MSDKAMNHKVAMPLQSNIPEGKKGWLLTTCPVCERECWKTPQHLLALTVYPTAVLVCTLCAIDPNVRP